MRILLIAALAALLAGCMTDATPTPPTAKSSEPLKPATPVQLTKQEIEAVQVGTRSSLKDPESARFGRMVAGQNEQGSIVVCLMVNAKNSYGGYTGEKPFMGMLFRDKKPMNFVLLPDDGRFPQYRDSSILKVCADSGISPI